jgi:putative DNA primase/helicase
MTGYFAQHAVRLADYGYDVIPISRHEDPTYKDAGKQPAQRKGWQQGCPRERWRSYASCGVGILTKRTPALDIDVLDPELAESIQAIADRVLGDAPIRIGRAPKQLMPFQLRGEPYAKMKVSWRGYRDELHEPTRPPAVEILAGGQQFVALGIHPGTGQPYQWTRDPDLSLPHGMLPLMDKAKAERFILTLADSLTKIGATSVKVSGVHQEREPSPKPEPTGRHPAAGLLAKLPSNGRGHSTTADEIRDALKRRGNADLDYDEWIKIGLAIKAALPGAEGAAIWEWWSHLSGKNEPAVTRKKWGTFKPERVTAATIFWGLGR